MLSLEPERARRSQQCVVRITNSRAHPDIGSVPSAGIAMMHGKLVQTTEMAEPDTSG